MTHSLRLAALLVVTTGAFTACQTGEAAEEAPSLQTVEVMRGDLLISAEASGQVEPIREVEVKSKASGEILRLHADIGDLVEPGALLADIDPRDVQNRFDQTEADLAVAQARLDISEAQLARSDQLIEAEVITLQEHENARLDFANAQATLVKAKTNFDLAVLQLNDVRISAPMAGTIIQKNVEEGVVIQSASGSVSGGTTLFLMANLGEMQVRTLVDETDMGALAAGMEATVKVEAFPDRTFFGVVDKIEPQATEVQNVTMFPVIVSIENRGGLLRPGMNAEVEIRIDEATGVLVVPNNAIVKTADVGPAAMALGLDIESLDLSTFQRAGRGGFRGQRGGGEGGAARRGGAGGPRPSADQRRGGGERRETAGARGAEAGQGRAGGREQGASGRGGGNGDAAGRFQEMRARVQSGEMTQEEMRAAIQGLRGGGAPEDGGPARRARPAVVFILGADSVPEPRLVQIGLNDWDHTEVVSGVEEGELLVVVGAAQLMAQQQAYLERIRERMGGGNPFGGSTRGGGRRR